MARGFLWLSMVLLLAGSSSACVEESPQADDDTADEDDDTEPGDDDTGSGDDDTTPEDDDTTPGDDDTGPVPVCGDGLVEGEEACDDEADNGLTACGCQVGCAWTPAGASCEDGAFCTDADACDGGGGCAAGPPRDCSDAEACTLDACDDASAACTHEGFDGSPLDLYDMAQLADPSTLDVDVLATRTVVSGLRTVEVSAVRYTSFEANSCSLDPIRVEAYLAVPTSGVPGGALPGLVVAHGLGGWAEEGNATGPAGDFGVVTLAFSGPGQGSSEGTGSTPDRIFDTVPDPRGSWLWGHSVAAIRGVTLLEATPGVDVSRLGMTGYSGGAVATEMAIGVDHRIAAAAPISATGHMDLAIAATPVPGWQLDILQSMTPPRDAASPEWDSFVRYVDPKNFLPHATADTLLVNGAADEFFPIHSTVASFQDLEAAGVDPRLLVIENWDHGWFALYDADGPTADIEDAMAFWIGHALGLDPGLAERPPEPRVDALIPWICYDPTYWWITWNCAAMQVSLEAPTGYDVAAVRFHFSVDGSLAYFTTELSESGGVWTGVEPLLDGTVWNSSNLAYFAEVELRDGLLGPSFKVTSVPSLPPGFVPNILPIDGSLPL